MPFPGGPSLPAPPGCSGRNSGIHPRTGPKGKRCWKEPHPGPCGRERWQEFNLSLQLLQRADLVSKGEEVREQMPGRYCIWGVTTVTTVLSLLVQYVPGAIRLGTAAPTAAGKVQLPPELQELYRRAAGTPQTPLICIHTFACAFFLCCLGTCCHGGWFRGAEGALVRLHR